MKRLVQVAAVAGTFFLFPWTAPGATVEIAPSHQAKILLAGLSFFKQLPADGNSLNIVVLGSCPVGQGLAEFEGKSVNSLALRFEKASRLSVEELSALLDKKPYAAIFDCGNADEIRKTAAIAQRFKVLHLGRDIEAVQHGAAIATEVHQGRPGLVLNLASVKSIGASFDGRLSGVARFIQ